MYGNQQDGIVADIKDDLETVRKMIEETKNEEEKDDNIIINIIVPNANPYIKNILNYSYL